MKNLILPLAAAIACCASCNLHAAEAALSVTGSFSELSANDIVNVHFTAAPKVNVTVNAPERILPQVTAVVKDDKLIIRSGKVKLRSGEKIDVFVTAPAVTTFTAADNSDIFIKSAINTEKLTLNAKDNADIKTRNITITSSDATVTTADNADIKISGTLRAKNLAASSKDNSDIQIAKIVSTNLAVNASDNAGIECKYTNTENIAANASDNADIELEGRATNAAYIATDQSSIEADDLHAIKGSAKASGCAIIKAHVNDLTSFTSGQSTIRNASH